jgi:hypothetical protein
MKLHTNRAEGQKLTNLSLQGLNSHNYGIDSAMRVAGILWVPTMHSREILQQAKGITLIESTLRRFLR